MFFLGYTLTPLVEALRYKTEGRGFDSQCSHESDCTMALGSIQLLTEMSTVVISMRGKGDHCLSLTTLPPSYTGFLEILGVSNSWSSNGIFRPVMR